MVLRKCAMRIREKSVKRIQPAKSADNGVWPRCTWKGESCGASTGEGEKGSRHRRNSTGDTEHITGK